MKISRWKIFKALKERFVLVIIMSLGSLPIIIAGIWFICRVIQLDMQGKNIYRLLDLNDNWWIHACISVIWILMTYAYIFVVEWGLILDVLFLPMKRLSDVSANTIIYLGKTDTFDRKYASLYWINIGGEGENNLLQLLVSKEFGAIPKGDKYNIIYLKHSKLVVKVEVMEGGREETPREIPIMDPPITPRYSKEDLIAMTKTHRLPSLVLLIYCIAGFVVLGIWGINSFGKFMYWYRMEIERCIGIWFFLIVLELFLVFLFRRIDRGYLLDLHSREICVTDVLPIETIYGKKFLCHVDKKIKDQTSGIELEVTEGTHKSENFLLYREISKYWNCFPMCASYHHRYRGPRFKSGEQKLKAVRLYYLKHSKIVVDMDVVEDK